MILCLWKLHTRSRSQFAAAQHPSDANMAVITPIMNSARHKQAAMMQSTMKAIIYNITDIIYDDYILFRHYIGLVPMISLYVASEMLK